MTLEIGTVAFLPGARCTEELQGHSHRYSLYPLGCTVVFYVVSADARNCARQSCNYALALQNLIVVQRTDTK